MKKICILSAVNIKHMTMISFYTDILRRNGIEFDIIYMDKYGIEEDFNCNRKYVFTSIINPKDYKLLKIYKYFKFRKFAISQIERNNYDFLIVWNDVAILMFSSFLVKRWRQKYCLNIRDYSGQRNKFIYSIFEKAIKSSLFTTISSLGYKKFLPRFDYLHLHSLNNEILTQIQPRTELRDLSSPIRISFVGNIRFFEVNESILRVFKNDERFLIQYFGTNATILEKFAFDNDITNVRFYDAFPVSKTAEFINQTDIINNLYGSGNYSLDYALSIKLYHGIYSRTPILVFPNTVMSEYISNYKIGYVVKSIDNNLPNELYEWYHNFDFNHFNKYCEILLDEVKRNNDIVEEVVLKHLT